MPTFNYTMMLKLPKPNTEEIHTFMRIVTLEQGNEQEQAVVERWIQTEGFKYIKECCDTLGIPYNPDQAIMNKLL